ncbi:hypothetical protein BGZ98_005587, partial [Dissophora globulifera]
DQGPENRDRQVALPAVTELYTPSAHEIELCPELGGEQDFFQGGLPSEEWVDKLRQHPKNTRFSYDPPALPAVFQCSDMLRAGDTRLTKIQLDLANLTRPIDTLLHQVLSADDISEDELRNFAFNEEIKVFRALSAAFAPKDKDNNNR